MDLAGPKLRTGPLERGPEVIRIHPCRDSYGQSHCPCPGVVDFGNCSLLPSCAGTGLPSRQLPTWLARLRPGERGPASPTPAQAKRSLHHRGCHRAGMLGGSYQDHLCHPWHSPSSSVHENRSRHLTMAIVGKLPSGETSIFLQQGDCTRLAARPQTWPSLLPVTVPDRY